ncbi:MAG: hypothetical protein Q7W51_02765 [Coriobacteriia bacterium]|nr:hypothetical protein [Coriobacteriia bacterium]
MKMSVVRAEDMIELQELPMGHHPIGITYINDSRQVWVCCYTGSLHTLREPMR